MKINQAVKAGGDAFPNPGPMCSDGLACITVRDYFAARFMERAQSLCENGGGWDVDAAAHCAYQMADAMMRARES